MSSLPVPVSPRIRTVASVGATSSTCSQYALQAGTLADDFVKLMRGDELFFEIAVFLFAAPQGFFGFSFFWCKVTDYAQNHLPLCRDYRAKHDINGKLTSILTAAIKVKSRTHSAYARVGGIVSPVSRVRNAESLRNEDLDRLPPSQLGTVVAKGLLDVRVDFRDFFLPDR